MAEQVPTWTNDNVLSIGPLGKNFCEILIEKYRIFFLEKILEKVIRRMRLSLLSVACYIYIFYRTSRFICRN